MVAVESVRRGRERASILTAQSHVQVLKALRQILCKLFVSYEVVFRYREELQTSLRLLFRCIVKSTTASTWYAVHCELDDGEGSPEFDEADSGPVIPLFRVLRSEVSGLGKGKTSSIISEGR